MNKIDLSTFELRIRLSQKDAHYNRNLIDGAKLLELAGDAATGLSINLDEDEGLLSTWLEVTFLKKVFPGDFLHVKANLTKKMRLRRNFNITITRFISSMCKDSSEAKVIHPEVVFSAKGTIVIPYALAKAKENVSP